MSKVGKKLKSMVGQASVPMKNFFRTKIPAQSASAGPPLGPLLGKYGLNIAKFCKDFNEQTKNYRPGIPLPLTIRIKPDRSYVMEIQTPPISFYLMQAAGIQKGGIKEENDYAGKVTLKHVYEIAKIKHEDPFGEYQIYDLDEVVKQVVNIACCCKIDIVRELDPEEYGEFLRKRNEFVEEVMKKREEERLLKLQRA